MHTAHLMLVRAESPEGAQNYVESRLTHDTTVEQWWDWFAIGSDGRYSLSSAIEGWTGDDYVVGLEATPGLFHLAVDTFYEYRRQAFDRHSAELENNGWMFRLDQDDMITWRLRRFADLSASYYCAESHVYDLHNFSANLDLFIKDTGTDWFAVLVDFHY